MQEMQRWIILGGVALLLAFGSGFGFWTIRQNRPYPVWVPLPLNPEFSVQQRVEISKELRKKLAEPEILIQISKDLKLPERLGVASDEAAANEIAKRLFVDIGEVGTPKGPIPALNIGFTGIKKDKRLSEDMSLQLMKEVMKIVGVKQPAKP